MTFIHFWYTSLLILAICVVVIAVTPPVLVTVMWVLLETHTEKVEADWEGIRLNHDQISHDTNAESGLRGGEAKKLIQNYEIIFQHVSQHTNAATKILTDAITSATLRQDEISHLLFKCNSELLECNDDADVATLNEQKCKLQQEEHQLQEECKKLTRNFAEKEEKVQLDDWCKEGLTIWDAYQQMMWPLLTGKVGPDSNTQADMSGKAHQVRADKFWLLARKGGGCSTGPCKAPYLHYLLYHCASELDTISKLYPRCNLNTWGLQTGEHGNKQFKIRLSNLFYMRMGHPVTNTTALHYIVREHIQRVLYFPQTIPHTQKRFLQ
eukprot:m.94469 g.94469  ORF g.94469 m.94469 type:complete len:324 (-) comp26721_c0_seq7:29-1000(-)